MLPFRMCIVDDSTPVLLLLVGSEKITALLNNSNLHQHSVQRNFLPPLKQQKQVTKNVLKSEEACRDGISKSSQTR